jgi:hypothetical protein
MAMNDPLDQVETDPSSLIVIRMVKTLKNTKQFTLVLPLLFPVEGGLLFKIGQQTALIDLLNEKLFKTEFQGIIDNLFVLFPTETPTKEGVP